MNDPTPPRSSDHPADASADLARYALVLAQLDALGIDPAHLAVFAATGAPANAMTGATTGTGAAAAPTAPRVAEFLTEFVLPACSAGERTVWRPYLAMFSDGYPQLCACFCGECLAHFKGDSSWTPCPCVTAGECRCTKADLARGEVHARSCAEHFDGYAARTLAEIATAHIDIAGNWAQLRAQKRTAARNRARGVAGRPTFAHDGRSALEHLRNAMTKAFKLALAAKVPGVTTNPALGAHVKARPPVAARSYTEEQLGELWDAIFAGGSDSELDLLIVWFILETGARRGGLISLTVGDLLFAVRRVRLGEKNGIVDLQPVTAELLEALLTHALERADVVVANPDAVPVDEITVGDVIDGRVRLRTDAPVLHYRPRTAEGPDGTETRVARPLTRKRFETLWGRLKEDLPWLDELHGRPHDLRKTIATFVERAHGHAVARAWLRHHTVGDSTGIYTGARDDEVVAAHRWLTGTDGAG